MIMVIAIVMNRSTSNSLLLVIMLVVTILLLIIGNNDLSEGGGLSGGRALAEVVSLLENFRSNNFLSFCVMLHRYFLAFPELNIFRNPPHV